MIKKLYLIAIATLMQMIFSLSYASPLPLPSNLIGLSSAEGAQIFNRSSEPQYFWPLAQQFVTQQGLTYCAIASSVMVLNALNVKAPADPTYIPFNTFTQENFFTPAVEKVLPSSLVKKQGVTLDALGKALATYSVTVKVIHANEISLEKFRDLAKKVITDKTGYIIVNISRPKMGEQGFGHVSPLAAYDETTDRFLMLDVARYRYPSAWIKTQDLWAAIHTFDKDGNAYRGLIIVKPSN